MKTQEISSPVVEQNSTSQSTYRNTIELVLDTIARLGRVSPCAELRSGALAAMSGSSHIALVSNGMEVAEKRGHERLHSALKEYLTTTINPQ